MYRLDKKILFRIRLKEILTWSSRDAFFLAPSATFLVGAEEPTKAK